jgi:CheY-like chemotaxis protein
VDTADNGVDGLWKATENAYDVIVLDVMLPGLDGYQVCRRIRERGRWAPILLLTAMDDDLDHAEGLDSGADDYLAKPFPYPVLLAHLRSLTRRTLGARVRTMTASRSIPTARAEATILTSWLGVLLRVRNDTATIMAAQVTSRPVLASPVMTAWPVERCSSPRSSPSGDAGTGGCCSAGAGPEDWCPLTASGHPPRQWLPPGE